MMVSVIIPLYNYQKYISGCIRSVLMQDYDDMEIIVVDDCSTDDSYKIACGFIGPKLKVIRHDKNRGYSAAKNTGIRASIGKYICLIDADDMLMAGSIWSRVKMLVKTGKPFVHANAVAIFDDYTLEEAMKLTGLTNSDGNHKNKKPYILRFPSQYDIHAQTVMLDRSLHIKYGLYDENLRSRSDREMWWRLFGKSDAEALIKRAYLDKCVAYYRYHQNSMMVMRAHNKTYDRHVRSLAEKLYKLRRTEGITQSNTIFLEK
jgi:glycosyltransferase involved in cell wall biosynthesis